MEAASTSETRRIPCAGVLRRNPADAGSVGHGSAVPIWRRAVGDLFVGVLGPVSAPLFPLASRSSLTLGTAGFGNRGRRQTRALLVLLPPRQKSRTRPTGSRSTARSRSSPATCRCSAKEQTLRSKRKRRAGVKRAEERIEARPGTVGS